MDVHRAADGVDAGVEISRVGEREAGPEQQLVGRGRQLGGAAVERAGLDRLVGGHQLVAAVRQLVRALEAEQAPQLSQRLAVVLDAQVDAGVPRLARGRHHEERGRLAAAHVASLALGRVERRHQPIGELALGVLERGGHRGRHRVALHHVGLAGPVGAAGIAGARDAVRPRVDRDAGARVHHADLAHGGQRIGGDQRVERVLRARPRLDPVERVRPVRRPRTTDWVATAPTPGRAQMHSEPTENQWDCTAAPSSPVAGSRATIE